MSHTLSDSLQQNVTIWKKGNPEEIIVQGYFSSQFFNDLFSRVILADFEISNNFPAITVTTI